MQMCLRSLMYVRVSVYAHASKKNICGNEEEN